VIRLKVAPVDHGVAEAEVGGAVEELGGCKLALKLPRAVIGEPGKGMLMK
jgi:hypothetical protein